MKVNKKLRHGMAVIWRFLRMGIVLLEITVHAHLHVLENPIMRFAVL